MDASRHCRITPWKTQIVISILALLMIRVDTISGGNPQPSSQRRALREVVHRLGGTASFHPESEATWTSRAVRLVFPPPDDTILIGGSTDRTVMFVVPITEHPEQIGDAELKDLFAQPATEHVTHLSLAGTSVSDGSLTSLKRLTRLKALDLGSTKLSPKGMAELQRALPNCEITYMERKNAKNGRNFGTQDYQKLKALRDNCLVFIYNLGKFNTYYPDLCSTMRECANLDLDLNLDGCPILRRGALTCDAFYGQLRRVVHEWADVDLDVLSPPLRAEILFYRRWEQFWPFAGHAPNVQGRSPQASYDLRDQLAFYREFEAEFLELDSMKDRVGVDFDLNVSKAEFRHGGVETIAREIVVDKGR